MLEEERNVQGSIPFSTRRWDVLNSRYDVRMDFDIEAGISRAEIRTWSTVARVQSGLRTVRLAFLRPSKACYNRDL